MVDSVKNAISRIETPKARKPDNCRTMVLDVKDSTVQGCGE